MNRSAHRTQGNFRDGFVRHLRVVFPNVSFIGFTGAPVESTDRNTGAQGLRYESPAAFRKQMRLAGE